MTATPTTRPRPEAQIAVLLAQRPGQSIPELYDAQYSGRPGKNNRPRWYRTVRRMEDAGLVERVNDIREAKYRLTANGRAYVVQVLATTKSHLAWLEATVSGA